MQTVVMKMSWVPPVVADGDMSPPPSEIRMSVLRRAGVIRRRLSACTMVCASASYRYAFRVEVTGTQEAGFGTTDSLVQSEFKFHSAHAALLAGAKRSVEVVEIALQRIPLYRRSACGSK